LGDDVLVEQASRELAVDVVVVDQDACVDLAQCAAEDRTAVDGGWRDC
jgi:hypothetical protein